MARVCYRGLRRMSTRRWSIVDGILALELTTSNKIGTFSSRLSMNMLNYTQAQNATKHHRTNR
jgi:hypothetical protein